MPRIFSAIPLRDLRDTDARSYIQRYHRAVSMQQETVCIFLSIALMHPYHDDAMQWGQFLTVATRGLLLRWVDGWKRHLLSTRPTLAFFFPFSSGVPQYDTILNIYSLLSKADIKIGLIYRTVSETEKNSVVATAYHCWHVGSKILIR